MDSCSTWITHTIITIIGHITYYERGTVFMVDMFFFFLTVDTVARATLARDTQTGVTRN